MQNKFSEEELPYRVGGLLYTPALNEDIAENIIVHKFNDLTSVALCLEDSINDNSLEKAERQLKETLIALKNSKAELPLIFVRIRSVEHLERIHSFLGSAESVVTGYVLPKFDLTNCDEYCCKIKKYNLNRESRLYIMPIIESKAVAELENRVETLKTIKKCLDKFKEYVLNIRVGGNDFCNMYGIRRTENQNIYQIGVIRDILASIVNVFASEYVVSGPVWEYFGENLSGQWAEGLRKELELDRLNGFIGKTAIHPSQLPVIYESLKVRKNDYEDAVRIVNWFENGLAVAKSRDGNRMNEVKCHLKWAQNNIRLAKIYGIR